MDHPKADMGHHKDNMDPLKDNTDNPKDSTDHLLEHMAHHQDNEDHPQDPMDPLPGHTSNNHLDLTNHHLKDNPLTGPTLSVGGVESLDIVSSCVVKLTPISIKVQLQKMEVEDYGGLMGHQ